MVCSRRLQPDETMNWVTVIWSTGAGACLTLALTHLIFPWMNRTALGNLFLLVITVVASRFAVVL
jgi:hypothetical protein